MTDHARLWHRGDAWCDPAVTQGRKRKFVGRDEGIRLAPTSPFLLAVLILGAAGSIGYAIFRLRRWWTRVAAAALGVVLAMTSGVAIVNDFYGYYQTWSALGVDFLGRTPELGRTAPAHRSAAVVETGGCSS